jgi:hypothetical protein
VLRRRRILRHASRLPRIPPREWQRRVRFNTLLRNAPRNRGRHRL